MKILVTYFEPFGSDDTNSSAEAAKLLDCRYAGNDIITCRLPVSFKKSYETAIAKIEEEHPAIVLCLGQAAGRAVVSIERIAVNIESAKSPDCDGCRPHDRIIEAAGPDAIMTRMDVTGLHQALVAGGIPGQVSASAGTFVCNSLYYRLMLHDRHLPVLFIHLPLTPRQASLRATAVPSMHSATSAAAIRTIIDSMISGHADLFPS